MSDIISIILFTGFVVVILWAGIIIKGGEQNKTPISPETATKAKTNKIKHTKSNQNKNTFSPPKISLADAKNDAYPTDEMRKKSLETDGIIVTKIPTELHGLNSVSGCYSQKDSIFDTPIEIDLDEQTCTCPEFRGKIQFQKNHMGRICVHLFREMKKQNAFGNLHYTVFTALILGLREETREVYTIKHKELPLMYLIIGKSDDWMNVYGRTKKGNQTIYEASGDFQRYGWNLNEKRWAFGEGLAGTSLITPFLEKLHSANDLALIARPFESETFEEYRSPKLTELADPRAQPNPKYFGPETDAWEIPNSLQTDGISLEITLEFSYIDKKNQRSRRKVDIKEIQFYGTEGEYIYGQCRLRHEGRTFKTSEMYDIIDGNTGEVINDITEYLKRSYSESSLGRLREWMVNNERIARAWLYLMQANKKPTRAEYDVLKTHFSTMLGGQSVTTKDIRKLFEDKKVTTPVGFQRLVSGIKKHHPEHIDTFVSVSERLVSCRKTKNFADEAALKLVFERLT